MCLSCQQAWSLQIGVMKRLRLIVILVPVFALTDVIARDGMCGEERIFQSSSRLTLGTDANLSASVCIADIDCDNDLDVVVANGRHWPQQNFLLINQGLARFNVQRALGEERSTTYASEVADLDGDDDLDIAVGNDMAPNRIFLGDGIFHIRLWRSGAHRRDAPDRGYRKRYRTAADHLVSIFHLSRDDSVLAQRPLAFSLPHPDVCA